MPNDRSQRVEIGAKFLRPRLDHVTLRREVRDAFAAALERRLTVVCAPAGYGKTTTTAAALDLCERRGAWYKLDLLDHDPLAFLTAITRSVQRLCPGFGERLLRELAAGPADVAPETVAARFCAECDRAVTSPGHLVLDDYQETIDAPAMNAVLGYLLENCPETLRFVVLTRYEPAFRLEKLRLAGELAWISRDLLLFDARQVAEMLRQHSGRPHSPEHVERLLALTEGWPASVVLAAMALAWVDYGSLEDALADPRMRGDIFSYLAEQVFQRQSTEVQRFLLRTSCLDHVNNELAARITGDPAASRHLHFLARNHIFTFATGREGTYRYHNLLRDFLKQRFVQDEGEPAFRALQQRTAAALETCDERPAAVELLLGVNETEQALAVTGRGGEAMLERVSSEQLRLWTGRLAHAAEAGHPWALVVAAVLDTREGRYAPALSALARAVEVFARRGDEVALYETLSIMEWAQLWSGDPGASIETCREALDHASSNAQRLHTWLSFLSAAVDLRRWDQVESASAEAAELLPSARPEEAARAQALHAYAAFYKGDMHLARNLVEGCGDWKGSDAQRAMALTTQGMIHIALGEYAAARRHLDEAADIAAGFGHSLSSRIEDDKAVLEASLGQFDVALQRLRRLKDHPEAQDPVTRCAVLTHEGTALRRSGSAEAGLAATQLAVREAAARHDAYHACNARADLALLQGLLGEEQTGALLDLASQAGARGLAFVRLKAILFSAILAGAAEERAEAVRRLEECLPQQLMLGHIDLVTQELCPRPELAGLVLRRHKSNGLGPALVDALSRHWRFAELSLRLRELCPSQVGTWIDHVNAGHQVRGPGAGAVECPDARRSPHRRASGHSTFADLTPREQQVLALMAEDRSNDEIAADLFIAVPTVKTHINHILRKLGQTKRIGAVLEYQRQIGTIPPGRGRSDDDRLHPPV